MLYRISLMMSLLLALTTASQAQTPPSNATVPVPAATQPPSESESMDPPMVGDQWTYEVRDEITGELKFSTTTIITDVTPTEIALRAQSPSFAGPGVYIYDRSWNLKNSPVWRNSPNDGLGVKLPLNVGNSWKFQSDAIYGPLGTTFKNSGSSKVVGQESITTSAGTFDTFKIETTVNGRNARDPTKRFELQATTWYAPSIDHWVKRISKTSFNGRVDADTSIELVDYGRR
ncbi:MAG TPA: hypothetical protein VGH13_07435 [Xanthobacteraceae bacterium]|jgi:hypothetical protein